MPDIVLLRRQARRMYELGRLRFAIRIAVVIVPFALLCARETGAFTATLILAASLLLVAITMRWRSREGVDAVAAGLGGGALPALASLALCRFVPSCPPDVALGICAGAGLVTGAIAGRAAIRHTTKRWKQWAGAAVVGALTAAMGCVALGLSAVAGASIGLALGGGAAVLVGLRHRVSA